MRLSLLFFILFSTVTALPVNAQLRNLEINFTHIPSLNFKAAGFYLYIAGDNQPVCTSDDPNATSMSCAVDIEGVSATFTLIAFSAVNGDSPHSETFTVSFDQSLTASFSSDPPTGPAPLSVFFDAAASTGNIIGYNWALGDGSNATGQATKHSYNLNASYTVTLSVTDNISGTKSTTGIVEVTAAGEEPKDNKPPTAHLSVNPGNGSSPLTVSFDGSGSSDPDNDPLTFSWDFGDGSTGSGIKTTHTYQTAGMLTAKLTVTDSYDAAGTTSLPIMVTLPSIDPNEPTSPVAVISTASSRGIVVLTPCSLGGNQSQPSRQDGTITTYRWDFGDGSTGSGPMVGHSYQTIGSYTVLLTVTDNLGKTATSTIVVKVTTQEEADKVFILLPVYQLLLGSKSHSPAQEVSKGAENE